MTRYSFAAALPAAVLGAFTALLLACTSPTSASPTSSPTPTLEASHTPEATPTAASSVLRADPTTEVDPHATPRPHLPNFGAWIVDAGTGEAAQLGGDANSFLSLRDSFEPAFTPDGTAVWLSRRDWTDARLYALDGTLLDTIEGAWGVIESPDGRSRAYYLRGEDDLTNVLVAERDGASHPLEGRHALPAFSPDGRSLAYYSIGDDNAATLDVLDFETGGVRTLATDVDPCPCDLTPHPQWSPSGTHIAYYDFAGNEGDSPIGAATYLVSLAGDRTLLAPDAPPAHAPGWFTDDLFGDRLLLEDFADQTASIFDLIGGTTSPLFMAEDDERFGGARLVGRSYVQVTSVIPDQDAPTFTTRLFDGVTGDPVASWDRQGDAAITPDGPAIATLTRSGKESPPPAECDGALVLHPALASPECLEGIDAVAWSPDGSRLATYSSQDDGAHIGRWSPAAGLRELAIIPSTAELIGWNPQGTRLLVSDRSGL